MAQMGEKRRIKGMNGIGELTLASDRLGPMGVDQTFPGPVIRMNGKLTDDDEATSTGGSATVIVDMALSQLPTDTEIGPVGKEADAV